MVYCFAHRKFTGMRVDLVARPGQRRRFVVQRIRGHSIRWWPRRLLIILWTLCRFWWRHRLGQSCNPCEHTIIIQVVISIKSKLSICLCIFNFDSGNNILYMVDTRGFPVRDRKQTSYPDLAVSLVGP